MGLETGRRSEGITLLDRFISETGWSRLSEGCAIAPAHPIPPPAAGSLIFDIDGVLIDTHRSFNDVIPRSVAFYMERVLGLHTSDAWMTGEEVGRWRRAGGFNNDWDTAEAGLLVALWRAAGVPAVPPAAVLAERTTAAGGGLAALRAIVEAEAGPAADAIFTRLDRPLLERIFKELYVGAPLFPRLFGEPARHYHGRGAVENETALLDSGLRDRACALPLGILTGRIPEEAALALELTGFAGLAPDRIVTDNGRFPPKPDPAGLLHLAGALTGRPLYYLGDNVDDLTTLRRTRAASGETGLGFIGCLSGGADLETVRWFASAGALLIAVEADDALREVLP